jgi:hypothetical protein
MTWQDVASLHIQVQRNLRLAIFALDEAIAALQEMQIRLAQTGHLLEEAKRARDEGDKNGD